MEEKGKIRKKYIRLGEIDLKEVERLATIGLNMDEIARTLGISTGTLYKKQRETAHFKEAIEAGRTRGTAVISNALFRKAADGDVKAGIWWMGVYAGRKQQVSAEVTGKDGGPIEISDARESLERKLLAFVATGAIAQVHKEPDE